MGITKTSEYDMRELRLAELAKAIGHPARIAILNHLAAKKECITNHLVHELPLSQATVSQHLKALKECGLIKGTISGTSVCYCIDPQGWGELKQHFEAFFSKNNPCTTGCC